MDFEGNLARIEASIRQVSRPAARALRKTSMFLQDRNNMSRHEEVNAFGIYVYRILNRVG